MIMHGILEGIYYNSALVQITILPFDQSGALGELLYASVSSYIKQGQLQHCSHVVALMVTETALAVVNARLLRPPMGERALMNFMGVDCLALLCLFILMNLL